MRRWSAGLLVGVMACGSGGESADPDASLTPGDGGNADAGQPDAMPPACTCLPSETCTADGCMALPSLIVQVRPDGALACGLDEMGLGEVRILESEGCIASQMGNPSYDPALEVGALTLSRNGETIATGTGANLQCSPLDFSVERPYYAAGDDMVLSIAGQGAVPATELTVTAPTDLMDVTVPDTVTTDQPITVTWAVGAQDDVELYFSGSGVVVRCPGVPDTGSFDVPAEMTAMLGPGSVYTIIDDIERRHHVIDEANLHVLFQVIGNSTQTTFMVTDPP